MKRGPESEHLRPKKRRSTTRTVPSSPILNTPLTPVTPTRDLMFELKQEIAAGKAIKAVMYRENRIQLEVAPAYQTLWQQYRIHEWLLSLAKQNPEFNRYFVNVEFKSPIELQFNPQFIAAGYNLSNETILLFLKAMAQGYTVPQTDTAQSSAEHSALATTPDSEETQLVSGSSIGTPAAVETATNLAAVPELTDPSLDRLLVDFLQQPAPQTDLDERLWGDYFAPQMLRKTSSDDWATILDLANDQTSPARLDRRYSSS